MHRIDNTCIQQFNPRISSGYINGTLLQFSYMNFLYIIIANISASIRGLSFECVISPDYKRVNQVGIANNQSSWFEIKFAFLNHRLLS